jgi:hypothetical protein
VCRIPLRRKKFLFTLNERMVAATGNEQLDREFHSQERLDALNIQKMLASPDMRVKANMQKQMF